MAGGGFLHLIGVFCLLGATVLLIVVSVSTPIWKSVYFLEAIVGTGGGQRLRMGQWGACITAAGDVAAECTRRKLGYNVEFLNNGNERISTAVVHGLTYALVLNPIAAGFSFLALLFALGTHFVLGLIGSIFAFFAFLVTLVALALDLGLFVTAHHRLGNQGIESHYGNALWMVVAACAAQLIASFFVCCTRSRSSRKDREVNDYDNSAAMSEPAGKRPFWQRKRNTAAY